MLIELFKIAAPLVVAAIVRVLEKRSLRKKGVLRDDKYMHDNCPHY